MSNGKHRVIGCEHLFFDEIDSTNSEALRHAKAGADEGLVIIANRQRCGRGRRQRTWLTFADSAVTMSILLRPGDRVAMSAVAQISLVAAVALCQALREFVPGLSLKWPNDLLFSGKKVAGILTEVYSHRQQMEAVVVGVGINLSPPQSGWPHEIEGRATDLATASGRSLSKEMVIDTFEAAFDHRYHAWIADGFASIATDWWHYHAFSGQPVRVCDGDHYTSGVAEGLGDDGTLLLRTEQGLERIITGDIEAAQPMENHR